MIQTTSKHWAQWSLYLPCFLGGDKAGVRFIVSASTLRHLARLFLSLLRLMWWVSTKQDLETKEENLWAVVVEWASFLCLWICTICFSCMFEWELLYILMSMFVCVFDCFALTSAFICAVAVSCLFLFVFFFFLIRRFPYNCYYYYCIVTIVSLFYCIFIWQLWRHVVHYKKKIWL